MKKNDPKKYLFASCAIAFLVVLIFVPTRNAHAQIAAKVAAAVGDSLSFTVYTILAGIAVGINAFLAIFLNGVTWVVGLMLQANKEILSAPVVQSGWQITRDLANLGFVLVILVMAFATIFRFQNYSMKSLLWKLIVAAVLVNFSLLIPSVFLNFTNILTNYFMDASGAGGNPLTYANTLLGTLHPSAVIPTASDGVTFSAAATNALSNITGTFFGALLSILYTVTEIFVMGALAVLFLVRYVHLVFLFILAPFAWLFWTIPNLSSMASRWWASFMRWCFFAPTAMFFIFLSTELGKGITFSQFQADPALAMNQQALINGSFVQSFTAMFLKGAFLIGSLIVANNFGVNGARAMQKFAMAPAGWAQRKAAQLGQKAVRKATTKADGSPTRLQSGINTLASVPFVGGVAPVLQGGIEKAKGGESKFYEDKYKGINQEMFNRFAASVKNPAEAAALVSKAQKEHWLGSDNAGLTKDTRTHLDERLKDPRFETQQSAVRQATPSLVYDQAKSKGVSHTNALKELKDFLKEDLSPAKAAEIDAKEFVVTIDTATGHAANTDENKMKMMMATHLAGSQLSKIVTDGSPELASNLKGAIKAAMDEFTAGRLALSAEEQNEINRVLEWWEKSPATTGNKIV